MYEQFCRAHWVILWIQARMEKHSNRYNIIYLLYSSDGPEMEPEPGARAGTRTRDRTRVGAEGTLAGKRGFERLE